MFSVKTSTTKTKSSNHKEAPLDPIDPDAYPSVANSLYLTRAIAGFYCAIAINMNRADLIEDIIEDNFKGIKENNVATGKRVIKRARIQLPTELD